MSFFSDAQETVDRYGKYITEFQELFRANEVSFGSPEDFFRLAPRLAYDDSFRTDFAVLARSVEKREEGRLTLTRMVTLVAIATGGMGIVKVGSASAVPISLVVVFLAGVGGWNETEPALVGVAQTRTGAREAGNGNGAAVPGRAATAEADVEREAIELEHRLAAGPGEDLETLAASLFGGPGLVKDALSRLEVNTLQLKLHLDSIDSRMERIEPHLDDLTWRFTAQTKAAPRPEPKVETKPRLPEQRYSQPESAMRPWSAKEEPEPRMEPWSAEGEQEPTMKPWPTKEERERELEESPSIRPWLTKKEEEPALEEEPAIEPWLRKKEGERELEESPPPSLSAREGEDPGRKSKPAMGAAAARDPEPVSAAGSTSLWKFTLDPAQAQESAPLPETELEPELPPRSHFDEYLREELEHVSEQRRLVWVRGIVIAAVVLTVAAGGLLYRIHAWQRLRGEWQSETGAAGEEWRREVAVTRDRLREIPLIGPLMVSADSSANARNFGVQPVPTPAEAPPVQARVRARGERRGAGSARGSMGSLNTMRGRARPGQEKPRPAVIIVGGLQTARVTEGGLQTAREAEGDGSSRMGIAASREGPGMQEPVFVDGTGLSVLSSRQPVYPDDALARGIAGFVVVQAIISRTGRVESAQIVSGPAGLLKASLDAVKDWRYRPYLVNGEPVEVRTFVTFQFSADQ